MEQFLVAFTGEQIRAARALTRIEQAELARRSSLSIETIKRLERIRGMVDANARTLRAIAQAFYDLGVVFEASDAGGMGVRLLAAATHRAPAHGGPGYEATRREQPLYRLTYLSRAAPVSRQGMAGVLRDIVRVSTSQNRALDLSGVLLAYDGRFLQALEGGKSAVFQVYGAICADARHTDIRVIESGPIAARRFPDRTLRTRLLDTDDPLFANEPSMAGGIDLEKMSPSAALRLLGVVAAEDHREALRA